MRPPGCLLETPSLVIPSFDLFVPADVAMGTGQFGALIYVIQGFGDKALQYIIDLSSNPTTVSMPINFIVHNNMFILL